MLYPTELGALACFRATLTVFVRFAMVRAMVFGPGARILPPWFRYGSAGIAWIYPSPNGTGLTFSELLEMWLPQRVRLRRGRGAD